MRINLPILAVIGHKGSGKTTAIEGLIPELTRRGFQVAVAKHINQKGFSLDIKGKDTWRYSMAGANPVLTVSDIETGILIRDGMEKFSIEKIFKFTQDAGVDILILEGFSSMVLKDRRVGKIICLRNREEYKEYVKGTQGQVIAFCSLQTLGEPVLKINEDLPVLVEGVLKFVEKKRKIFEILNNLAGLDCKKCSRATCEELAEDIYDGKAALNNCVPLMLKSKLKTKILIEDAEIPIQPFVSEIIRKSVLGMFSTLKGVTIEGDEEVYIRMSRRRNI